jgi:hypothetical protein
VIGFGLRDKILEFGVKDFGLGDIRTRYGDKATARRDISPDHRGSEPALRGLRVRLGRDSDSFCPKKPSGLKGPAGLLENEVTVRRERGLARLYTNGNDLDSVAR